MQKKLFKKIYISIFLCTFFVPAITPVFAVSTPDFSLIPCSGTEITDNGANNGRECTFNDLVTLAQNVAKKIVQLGLIVAPIIFAYAGYLLITSSDSPGQRDTAKKIGWNVAKGLVVMMLAWVFVNLILTTLLGGDVLKVLPWGK